MLDLVYVGHVGSNVFDRAIVEISEDPVFRDAEIDLFGEWKRYV